MSLKSNRSIKLFVVLISIMNFGYFIKELPDRAISTLNNVSIETFFNLQNPLYFSDSNVISFFLETFIIIVIGVDISDVNNLLVNQIPLW